MWERKFRQKLPLLLHFRDQCWLFNRFVFRIGNRTSGTKQFKVCGYRVLALCLGNTVLLNFTDLKVCFLRKKISFAMCFALLYIFGICNSKVNRFLFFFPQASVGDFIGGSSPSVQHDSVSGYQTIWAGEINFWLQTLFFFSQRRFVICFYVFSWISPPMKFCLLSVWWKQRPWWRTRYPGQTEYLGFNTHHMVSASWN